MKTDYKWLFCEPDLAGIMLLVFDFKEIRTIDLLRVSSNYDKVKKGAQKLTDLGLLKKYSVEAPHPATTYMLTQKGMQVASLLKSVKSLLDEEYRIGTLDENYDQRKILKPESNLGVNQPRSVVVNHAGLWILRLQFESARGYLSSFPGIFSDGFSLTF